MTLLAQRLEEVARELAAGAVACIPTESTYGLAASLHRGDALEVIAGLKQGRGQDSPFPLIACDAEQARSLAAAWPPQLDALAAAHWPGPLTLVVPARAGLHPAVVAGTGTVGVRVSSHPIASGLARALGAPISATSANPHGAAAAASIDEARAYFGDAVVYVDGGPCTGTVSTVVALGEGGRLQVLRQGAVVLRGDG